MTQHSNEIPIDPDLDPDDPSEPHVPDGGTEPPHVHRRRGKPDVLVAIALGGMLGTLARAGLGQMFPTPSGNFPSTTLVINIAGSFLLGVLLVAILDRVRTPRHLRPFVATGVLGSFTTFSTLTVGVAQLARNGQVTAAASYLVISVVGGCAAALAGILCGHRLADPVGVTTPPVRDDPAPFARVDVSDAALSESEGTR